MAGVGSLDFDTYLAQRLSEFFGPDLGGFFPALGGEGPVSRGGGGGGRVLPVTVRPERGVLEATGRAPWVDVESLAEQEVTETEPYRPSRREIRRAFRQYIPIDICEIDADDGGYYLVEAELPGVPKENISVHVDHNNVLSIDARPPPVVSHTCALLGEKQQQQQNRPSFIEPAAAAEGRAPETPAKPSQLRDLPTPQESPTAPEKEHQQQQQQHQQQQQQQQQPGIPAVSPRKFMLSERTKGRLHRSIRLPRQADAEKVTSCLVDGVLCLRFGRIPEAHSSRRIDL